MSADIINTSLVFHLTALLSPSMPCFMLQTRWHYRVPNLFVTQRFLRWVKSLELGIGDVGIRLQVLTLSKLRVRAIGFKVSATVPNPRGTKPMGKKD